MDVVRRKVMVKAKDVQVEDATCGSRRCAVKVSMTQLASVQSMVRELSMVEGVGKAIYRRTDLGAGYRPSARAVVGSR